MRLPRTSPLYWGQLSRTTAKEFAVFGVIGVLLIVVALFEPYSHKTSVGGIQGPQALPERLGYAILLRAGYAEVKLIDSRDERAQIPIAISDVGPDERISLKLIHTWEPELDCLNEFPSLGVPDVGQIDVRSLTMAIVAAEKYNRPPLQRRLEAWFAALWLPFRGTLSEFSLGLAQLRPATARRLLQEELGQFELSDRDLLALLMNDCHNIRLAAKYIEALCHQFASADSIDELIARVARTYSGAVTPTIQGLRYVDAVTGAYHLLQQDSTEESPEDTSNQEKVAACVPFEMGSITAEEIASLEDIAPLGTTQKLDQSKPEESTQATSEEKVEVAEVHIYFWHNDPGPKMYVARLAAQRKDWLVGKLVEIGYPRDRIVITELSPPKYLRQRCEDSDSSGSWAGIEVQKGNKGERRQ